MEGGQVGIGGCVQGFVIPQKRSACSSGGVVRLPWNQVPLNRVGDPIGYLLHTFEVGTIIGTRGHVIR